MATSTTSISNLDSYYQSLINYTIAQEKTPITNLTKKKDEVTVKKNVYMDLKTRFEALNTAIKTLQSSQATYALTAGRQVTITAPAGFNVFTASGSNSAPTGSYDIAVTTLAKTHEVRSIRQTYSDQPLGLTGTFVLGGAAVRSAAIEGVGLPDTVASIVSDGSNTIAPGQKELGTGAYYIETRQDATEGWQFRIVDAEGNAQNIQSVSDSTFTTNWQKITKGAAYDSGRGLTVNFGADDSLYTAANKATGAVKVNYSAQGASIDVTAGMSLADVTSAINGASFADGNEVNATIIDKTLILKNQYSGAAHVMTASDTVGTVLSTLGVKVGGVLNTKVSPVDAEFSVNGMTMTRSSNTGLTDVINGMTINLASDAEGKTANLAVISNMAPAQAAINSFISSFNEVTTYVRGKTTTVKNADNTYTRGALVGEQNLRYSANDLIAIMSQDQANTGIYLNLAQIGISVNSDLSLSISDQSKLSTALNSHTADVTKLMDVAMSALSAKVETYTGTTGYISQSLTSADNTITNYTSRITSMNERLTRRQDSLVKQYADLQAQMSELTNTYNMNSSLYG